MGYLLSIVTSAVGSFTTMFSKAYMNGTRHIKTGLDIYMLFVYPLITVYYFILAGGNVPLNWPTFWFATVYAIIALITNSLNLVAFNHATIVYITVFGGAAMLLPFLYELIFTDVRFSVFQYLAVGLRIVTICLPLLSAKKEESISKKGFLLCFLLFLFSGLSSIVTRMFSTHPNVMSDGSYFFWINVMILPFAFLKVFTKTSPKQLWSDFRQVKLRYFFFVLIALVINNAITFISIELVRQITSTVYSILSGTVRILVMGFLSVVVYKEKLTYQAGISLLLSLVAMILSLF